MHFRLKALLPLLLLLSLFLLIPVFAQDDPEPAEIVNDEGGAVIISGVGDYTFPNFNVFFDNPYIILADMTPWIIRERPAYYDDADTSQVIGKITSNPFNPPFTYQLSLPIEPLGELHDVDNDIDSDTGVMVFYIGIAENILGDPFAEPRDFMRGFLSSIEIDILTEFDILGGTILIYAPDDEQGFPSGFGEDGQLFTEDDPTVIVPQGYTLVDLDTEPFVFDRSREPEVDLFEPEITEANDFTDLTYTEAFDAMIDLYKTEYAFTEYKEVDWDALAEEYRPAVEAAEVDRDAVAFQEAVRELTYSVPDGHLRFGADNQAFQRATAGGLGLAIRELDDGRIIVNFITPDGPAEEAGIELRAEVFEIDGTPIEERQNQTVTFAGPFSTYDFQRLQQLRYSTRFPLEKEEVEITYQNPSDEDPTTITLPLSNEGESFAFSSFNAGVDPLQIPLPVTYEILQNGYGLITINSFSDDLDLTMELWERALAIMIQNNIPGLVIDMRRNGGGSAFMADQMPAYFFDEELILGYSAFYDERQGEFFYDPELGDQFVLPPEQLRYDGEVAVLIHPLCASACESFVYNMTLQDRAAVVGQYTTSGLGGSVVPIFLPDGVFARITNGRSLDANGEIHIEGIGVPPTVRVPVTEETLFAEGDIILQAAVDHLEGVFNVPASDAGTISIGETVTGQLVQDERVHYLLEVPEGDDIQLDFLVEDESGQLDTVLRLYLEGSTTPQLENDDDSDRRNTFNSGLRGITVEGGLNIVIEVAGFNDAEEGEFTLTVRETGTRPDEATDDEGDTEAVIPDSEALATIIERATDDEDFEILVEAVISAQLDDTLNGEGPFTVFAPTDEAFAAAMEDLVANGLFVDPETLLTSLLLYHVIEGEFLAEDIAELDGETLSTLLEGTEISIKVENGDVILNDTVTIVVTDIVVANGIIHVIDAVLLPPME